MEFPLPGRLISTFLDDLVLVLSTLAVEGGRSGTYSAGVRETSTAKVDDVVSRAGTQSSTFAETLLALVGWG